MLLTRADESTTDASEEPSLDDSSSPLQGNAETETETGLQNSENNNDGSDSEDFEDLNDEASHDKRDARDLKPVELYEEGSETDPNLDDDPNAVPSDANESMKGGTRFDSTGQTPDEPSKGSDGEVSEADSDLDEELPLEEARKAKDQLLIQKLIERQQKRNTDSATTGRDPSIKRFRNIDLFSFEKRHSKSDLLEEEEGEEGGKDDHDESDGERQNGKLDASPTTSADDLKKSDSKETSVAETERGNEPSVADTADNEGTESVQEETRNPSESLQGGQTEPTYQLAGDDETKDNEQTLLAADKASAAGNSMLERAELPTKAKPAKLTGDDVTSDSAIPIKVEAPASSERESKDETDGDAATQNGKSKSKKPKDSKKMKSKKKEKRVKDKKSKTGKSTSKKTKPKRKTHGRVGSQRRQRKSPSGVPLDTLDEQSEHDPASFTSQDPKQSETTLSLLLNSIEQSHLVSRSNQTVGEYSAGSFISDTGWSDGTSSSYDSDEDDNSLSSSGSLKAEHDNGEEQEKEDTAKQNLDTPSEQQGVEIPLAPDKDQPSPKLATTQIVKRLFAKKKYDSLDGETDAVQKSPSGREATAPRKSTSLNIVANLFRRRKQRVDVPKALEDDTELGENAGVAKEKETHDTHGVNDTERQDSPTTGRCVVEGENIKGDAVPEAVTNGEIEAEFSSKGDLKEKTARNQESVIWNDGNADKGKEERIAGTPDLRVDGNNEGKPEDGDVQGVDDNEIESEKEKHKSHMKKKDGQTKKKKDKGVAGNRARSDSAEDDSNKEKEGDSKKRSKSATNGKKKRKPTDSNKQKDSPGQEANVLTKKKTKKPVEN